jgi:hypothetical protein
MNEGSNYLRYESTWLLQNFLYSSLLQIDVVNQLVIGVYNLPVDKDGSPLFFLHISQLKRPIASNPNA